MAAPRQPEGPSRNPAPVGIPTLAPKAWKADPLRALPPALLPSPVGGNGVRDAVCERVLRDLGPPWIAVRVNRQPVLIPVPALSERSEGHAALAVQVEFVPNLRDRPVAGVPVRSEMPPGGRLLVRGRVNSEVERLQRPLGRWLIAVGVQECTLPMEQLHHHLSAWVEHPETTDNSHYLLSGQLLTALPGWAWPCCAELIGTRSAWVPRGSGRRCLRIRMWRLEFRAPSRRWCRSRRRSGGLCSRWLFLHSCEMSSGAYAAATSCRNSAG